MCNFRLFLASNLCEHQTKAAFDLKLMVGWGEHKVIFDKSGFRAYRRCVFKGWNFYAFVVLLNIV